MRLSLNGFGVDDCREGMLIFFNRNAIIHPIYWHLSLSLMLKSTCLLFLFSVPHPSENFIQIRIQMYGMYYTQPNFSSFDSRHFVQITCRLLMLLSKHWEISMIYLRFSGRNTPKVSPHKILRDGKKNLNLLACTTLGLKDKYVTLYFYY